MMRKTITRTLATSEITGYKVAIKDGKPEVETLPVLTVAGKAKDATKAYTDNLKEQEAKNKDLMTQKFVSVRQKAKVVRTNSKAASQYYKNMMQLNVVDPQFMDKQK